MVNIRVKDKDFLNSLDKIAGAIVEETSTKPAKKTFIVTIDVTMSGDLEIEAETEEKARAIAMAKSFTAHDLRNFHFLHNEIYDCTEAEEV